MSCRLRLTSDRRLGSIKMSNARAEDPADSDAGDPETVARIICLRLLDRRAYTRAELSTALARRGVPESAANTVLDRFREVGLIDDLALAADFATARHTERGLAARAISTQLHRRGIDPAVIAKVTEGIDTQREAVTARALVDTRLRRMEGLDPAVQARRLASLLARKGYSAEVTYSTVRAAIGAVDAEGEC